MLIPRATQGASCIFTHPTPSICLVCRVSLTPTYAPSSTRSYRASTSSPGRSQPFGPSRASRFSGSQRPSRTQHEHPTSTKREPRSLNSIRKAKRRTLWGKRAEEATAHYSPDDPFHQMSLARNEGGKQRSRPIAKRPQVGDSNLVNEKATESASPELKAPAVIAKEKVRGKASRSSLAPHDTIALTNTKKQPPIDRHATALTNKFFQKNYSFLFSSSSIQNQPLNKDTPEVVVLGASNAGKSTFLNGLFGRRDAAKVSSKAGHTRTLNGHGIGHPLGGVAVEKGGRPPRHGLVVVDTPGYGYKSIKAWGDEIHRYIEKRDMLKGAILLIPQPKQMTDMDRWVLKLLASLNKRTLIILTKADEAGRDWRVNLATAADKIREECKKLSGELQSGWKENDGWVPTIYATAAGWEQRLGMENAPGMAGARKAILEELAGVKIAKRKVEAAPEHKAYHGDMVSWDSLMGVPEANKEPADSEEVVLEEPVVKEPADITKRMRGRRRLR